jgi:hypothetical protein
MTVGGIPQRDLVVLAADKNIDYGLRGLFQRPLALRTRPIDAQIIVHPRRDPGCVLESHEVLRPFIHQFAHALVIFDREGSGREVDTAETVEHEVRGLLNRNGWADRADVVVLDPELEIWVFGESPHVERCLGWDRKKGTLRKWLEKRGLWINGARKPTAPREALDRVLRELNKPRSSALYQCLGERVGIKNCTDRAFLKFLDVLGHWFPAN